MRSIVTDRVAWSVTVSVSVALVSPAKMAEPIKILFGLRTRKGPREPCIRWSLDTPSEGAVLGKEEPIVSIGTFCQELCKNGGTNRFAVWIVDSGAAKEGQVQSYSPGGTIVPAWESTLALPGQYDWTVCLRPRCSLMSNDFDHLLFHFTLSF